MDSDPVIASATTTELMCDPNAAYPTGSVCWGVQQAVDAKALASQGAVTKPCLGTPILKGVSNCTLLGVAAAIAVVMMTRD